MESIIFIGIQATGKSTFYREYFFKTHVRINLDMLKTRHREALLLKVCLEMKQPFVVDNTNPRKADRQRYIPLARAAGFQVIGYYFQSDLESCLERNLSRSEEERIPEAGIRRSYSLLELPSYREGFDRLYRVSIAKDNTFIVKYWPQEHG